VQTADLKCKSRFRDTKCAKPLVVEWAAGGSNVKQFSIRDLLLLVVIVALALGWWFDRRPASARFEMQAVSNHVFIFDKATGAAWAARIEQSGELLRDKGFDPPKLTD
jgi:hypothetical protein